MFVEVRGYFISVLWLSTKKQRGSDTVRQQWSTGQMVSNGELCPPCPPLIKVTSHSRSNVSATAVVSLCDKIQVTRQSDVVLFTELENSITVCRYTEWSVYTRPVFLDIRSATCNVLADRTNGRAIGTLLRPSSSVDVVCDAMYCG